MLAKFLGCESPVSEIIFNRKQYLDGSITTGFNWIGLGQNVYVRFEKGTSSGTTSIFNIGDKWEFVTEPLGKNVGGERVVKSY